MGMVARPETIVEVELVGAGNGWTDISRDVVRNPSGIQIRRGIRGTSVTDRTASTGTAQLVLDNDRRSNSAGVTGYYSPDHGSCRVGFKLGIGIRIREMHPACGIETQIVGTIESLKPSAGPRGRKQVELLAVDWMEEAARFKIRGLATQEDVRGDQLITSLLAIMPRQPAATSFDTGKDVFEFAFDSIRDGSTSARAELDRIVRSGYDLCYVRRDGTLRYENRDYRFVNNANPVLSLNNTMFAMEPVRNTQRIINRAEVTAHPREADDEYSVLFSLQDRPLISPGETRTIRGSYTDPEGGGRLIGALGVIVPPVSGVDYQMNRESNVAVGEPDTAAIVRPTAQGHYSTFSLGAGASKPAAVSDQSAATYLVPPVGLAYETFALTNVDAPSNAKVKGVKLIAQIQHNSSDPAFAVWYPRLRYAGIDLDGLSQGTYVGGTATFTTEFPTAPGGGEWTAGHINNLEAGGALNWGTYAGGDFQVPWLLDLRVELIYASGVLEEDLTDDFGVVATPGGTSVEFAITNNGTVSGYVNRLQIRGRRLTAYEPISMVESDSASIALYGERSESFDMPYQGSSALAQAAADYIVSRHKDPITYLESVSILGNRSDTLMRAALTIDISDLIEIIEPVTGISRKYFVNGVSLDIGSTTVLATWILVPADTVQGWVLGRPGRSELGSTTFMGPF